MINWRVRIKNWTFWTGLFGCIGSVVMAGLGLAYSDFTTWESVSDAFMAVVSNPYMVGSIIVAVMSFLGVAADPTTEGISDSDQALQYSDPK